MKIDSPETEDLPEVGSGKIVIELEGWMMLNRQQFIRACPGPKICPTVKPSGNPIVQFILQNVLAGAIGGLLAWLITEIVFEITVPIPIY